MAYKEVLGVDLAMLGQVEVLLRNQHALTEQVLVDLLAVRLGDQPVSQYQYRNLVSGSSSILTSWRRLMMSQKGTFNSRRYGMYVRQ